MLLRKLKAFILLAYKICICVGAFVKNVFLYDKWSFNELNIFPWALVHCKWYFLNWPRAQSTSFSDYKERHIWCLLRSWRMRDMLENKYFEICTLDIYIFGWCNSDFVCAWNKSERGFDVNVIFRLAPRLLCIRAVTETQALLLIGCSELHRDQQQDCNCRSAVTRGYSGSMYVIHNAWLSGAFRGWSKLMYMC